MCLLTAEQFEAERRGEFTSDFGRLAAELARAERSQPARDIVARRSLEMEHTEPLVAAVRKLSEEKRRQQRMVARDLRTHGQIAADWYGATSPDLLPVGTAPGGGTRRLDSGRPGGRAVARASSRGGDSGDSDPDEPEPGPGSGLDLDAWLADRRRVLAALIGRSA